MRPNHFTKGWQILIALLLVSPVAAQNGKGDVIKACLDKIKSLVIEATDLSNGGGFGLTRFQAHGRAIYTLYYLNRNVTDCNRRLNPDMTKVTEAEQAEICPIANSQMQGIRFGRLNSAITEDIYKPEKGSFSTYYADRLRKCRVSLGDFYNILRRNLPSCGMDTEETKDDIIYFINETIKSCEDSRYYTGLRLDID